MKAASARPRALEGAPHALAGSSVDGGATRALIEVEAKRPRVARIVQRKEDAVDEREMTRRKLLHRFLGSEGRAQVTQAANAYLAAGFELPTEQEAQLKMLEHFDEAKARAAMEHLSSLFESEEPRQLPLIRQRLRRLEDHADEASTRDAAAALRRSLPA